MRRFSVLLVSVTITGSFWLGCTSASNRSAQLIEAELSIAMLSFRQGGTDRRAGDMRLGTKGWQIESHDSLRVDPNSAAGQLLSELGFGTPTARTVLNDNAPGRHIMGSSGAAFEFDDVWAEPFVIKCGDGRQLPGISFKHGRFSWDFEKGTVNVKESTLAVADSSEFMFASGRWRPVKSR